MRNGFFASCILFLRRDGKNEFFFICFAELYFYGLRGCAFFKNRRYIQDIYIALIHNIHGWWYSLFCCFVSYNIQNSHRFHWLYIFSVFFLSFDGCAAVYWYKCAFQIHFVVCAKNSKNKYMKQLKQRALEEKNWSKPQIAVDLFELLIFFFFVFCFSFMYMYFRHSRFSLSQDFNANLYELVQSLSHLIYIYIFIYFVSFKTIFYGVQKAATTKSRSDCESNCFLQPKLPVWKLLAFLRDESQRAFCCYLSVLIAQSDFYRSGSYQEFKLESFLRSICWKSMCNRYLMTRNEVIFVLNHFYPCLLFVAQQKQHNAYNSN